MKHCEIKTKNAPLPVGPYSQAIVFGKLIFISGQIGIHPHTNVMGADVLLQTHQAIQNISAILKRAGTNLNKVLRVDLYITHLNNMDVVNKIYAEYFFNNPKPARAVCVSVALPKNALIEISCIAYRDNPLDE